MGSDYKCKELSYCFSPTPALCGRNVEGKDRDTVVKLAETICNTNGLEISLLKGIYLCGIYVEEDFWASAV